MKYQLLKPINSNYSTIETILTNRGIRYEDCYHYLHASFDDVSSPLDFGEDNLKHAAELIIKNIKENKNALVICDCDCDGFTAAALYLNYLHDLFPSYVENNIKWFVHEDKQHGLSDVMDYINMKDFNLVIIPDAGSNDYEYHKQLKEKGIDIIILDHHLADHISENACVINNQLSNYKNKELSGVGVVWQFCRYLDDIMGTVYADQYLDLVALGLTGDMMSLTSIETRVLISEGFKSENIHNPYIYEMWQKNKFKLGEQITSIDAAFYIVPMINAVQRSGTIEEKELLFNSMLKYKAFENIPSNKRGHKPGEMERLVDQAVRMSTNVKNRQTRVQDSSIEFLEGMIEKDNLLNNKVLLFLLEPGHVDKNIAGLIANKFMAKYQRPCCILTDTGNSYAGSARGYDKSGITNFKDICSNTKVIDYAEGHQGAFGLSIPKESIESFIKQTDVALENMSAEPIYYVDYIYNGADVKGEDITTIAGLGHLWGKDFDESLIAIKDIKITKDMVTVYRKTSNTLKITLPNKINIMKFNATEDECYQLENYSGAYIQLDIVGTCHLNEWMGNYTPQVFIENYEITGEGKYLF